jgi:prepilin-type N-terminal cleavage/methylation domain-containing protein
MNSSMKFNKSGFTLIEVLVALTLLGLIATMLVAGTRLGLDISAHGSKRAEDVRMRDVKRDILRRQLQGALPYRYWAREENKQISHTAFEGGTDRLRFISRYGVVDGPNSLPRWIDLHQERSASGENKLMIEERYILPPDNQPGQAATVHADLGDCEEPNFQYLDISADKPQWTSTWNDVDAKAPLPSAVRIECKGSQGLQQLLVVLDYAESGRQGLVFQ